MGNYSASTALAASLIIKAAPGRAFSISGYNSKGSAQFIQIHDSATLPADNAAPIAVITVAATSNFSFTIPAIGLQGTSGLVVCNSSTAATKTIGSADCFFTAIRD